MSDLDDEVDGTDLGILTAVALLAAIVVLLALTGCAAAPPVPEPDSGVSAPDCANGH